MKPLLILFGASLLWVSCSSLEKSPNQDPLGRIIDHEIDTQSTTDNDPLGKVIDNPKYQ